MTIADPSTRERTSSKKDTWDKFKVVATIVVGLLSAAFARVQAAQRDHIHELEVAEANRNSEADRRIRELEVANANSNQQAELMLREKERVLHEVEISEKFLPHLCCGTVPQRQMALLMMEALGHRDLMLKISATLAPSDEARDVGNAAMRRAGAATSSGPGEKTGAPVTSAKGRSSGWVYLGDYEGPSKGWRTHYLEFDKKSSPQALVDRTFAVRDDTGALNVRSGMPSVEAEFGAVIRTVNVGQSVTIKSVHAWNETGFWWAEVEFAI